jgi:hypothetical protein
MFFSKKEDIMPDRLREISISLWYLVDALIARDNDKAFEAISVTLLQTMEFYGPDDIAAKEFFPVYEVIKDRIDAGDLDGALRQTRRLLKQIDEVFSIIAQQTQARP